MDPQACLVELLNHVRAGEHEEASERLSDLMEWTQRGGFVPDLAKALKEVASS